MFDTTTLGKVADHFLRNKDSITSTAIEAALLKTSACTVARTRRLTAMMGWMVQSHDSIKLLRQVSAELRTNGGQCLLLTEKFKADESSFRMRVSDQEQTKTTALAEMRSPGPLHLSAVGQQSTPTKILQSNRAINALFHLQDGQRSTIMCERVASLTVMSPTQSKVYDLSFQSQRLPLEAVAQDFVRRQTLVTTDGDPSIAQCMRGVAAINQSVAIWHYQCDVHKISNAIKDKVEGPEAQCQILNFIALSLSLQTANSMRVCREPPGGACRMDFWLFGLFGCFASLVFFAGFWFLVSWVFCGFIHVLFLCCFWFLLRCCFVFVFFGFWFLGLVALVVLFFWFLVFVVSFVLVSGCLFSCFGFWLFLFFGLCLVFGCVVCFVLFRFVFCFYLAFSDVLMFWFVVFLFFLVFVCFCLLLFGLCFWLFGFCFVALCFGVWFSYAVVRGTSPNRPGRCAAAGGSDRAQKDVH